MRRSLHVHNLLGRSESLGSVYAEAINRLSVATLVLDETGCVLQLNDVARQMLAQADGIKLVGTRLEASYPSDNRELHKLIRDTLEQQSGELPGEGREALSIARPSGEVSLGVVVEALPVSDWAEGKGRPTVIMYIRDSVGRSQADNRVTRNCSTSPRRKPRWLWNWRTAYRWRKLPKILASCATPPAPTCARSSRRPVYGAKPNWCG